MANKGIASETKFWDAKAPVYDRLVKKYFRNTYQVVSKHIADDTGGCANLLDAATGTGTLALHLSKSIRRITAIDLSSEMIRVANEKSNQLQVNNIDFRVGDIYNLPFADKSFNTVLASNILHLLAKPELALQEIRRVLVANGTLIAPTFCHAIHLRSKIFTFILSLLGQKPKNIWTPKSFAAFIENNGFSITKQIVVNGNIPLAYLVAINRMSAFSA